MINPPTLIVCPKCNNIFEGKYCYACAWQPAIVHSNKMGDPIGIVLHKGVYDDIINRYRTK